MGKTDKAHEIAIKDQDGVEVGLTLAKRNGVPVYQETVDPAISDQFFSGEVDYSKLPPEKELRLSGGDLRSGFGLEFAGQSTTRYHSGVNIDARYKEGLRLGGLPATVTSPAGISVIPLAGNLDFEAESSWTNGARSNGQVYEGSYSWLVNNTEAYQDATTWNSSWQSQTFYFQCWVWCDVTDTAYIGLNDGVTETYSDNHNGSSSWELLTVSKTLAANATRVRLLLYDGGDATTYFDSAHFSCNTYNTFPAQADFNNLHYVANGTMLFKQNANGTQYDLVRGFPAYITDLMPVTISGTDYLLIGQGWSNPYWYMTAGETATVSELATKNIAYFCEYAGTVYGANTNSTVVSTTNPLNGGSAWGNSKQIGDDGSNIISMVTYGGLVHVRKSDCQVYYLDDATPASANVITLISAEAKLVGTNARMLVWRDAELVIPYGRQGLILYDGVSLAHIEPPLYANNVTAMTGQLNALAGDDTWLYAIFDDDGNSDAYGLMVLAGREENVNGETDWRWHPLSTVNLTYASTAAISTHVKKRLWIGGVGTESLYYIPVTKMYGNVDSDTDMTYKTGGYLITPYYHFNPTGENKAFLKMNLRIGGTTPTIYWRVYYELMGDTTWTEIDTLNPFTVSPQSTRYLVEDKNTPIVSTMIRFKFEGITNDTATSPVLYGWDCKAIWYPEERKIISCMVLVDDNLPDARGQVDRTLSSKLRDTLDNINASSWPRASYPPYWETEDDTVYVKKLPMPSGTPQLEMMKMDTNTGLQWIYRLVLEVIPME